VLLAAHPLFARVAVAPRTPDFEATKWARQLSARRVPVVGYSPFRLDASTIGGPDRLVGGRHEARLEEIERILYPGGRPTTERRGRAAAFDIDVVNAHAESGNDHLVTTDGNVLHHRDELHERVGVSILTPEEALGRLTPVARVLLSVRVAASGY
jgi:hypothetical protein